MKDRSAEVHKRPLYQPVPLNAYKKNSMRKLFEVNVFKDAIAPFSEAIFKKNHHPKKFNPEEIKRWYRDFYNTVLETVY